ncbi:MAG TPA: N-6 DNA methylase, partial [Verrucomicrobiae bacterium]|nr:N-6 DNA methylase [Verrucomicrobiae bacterium]
LASYIVNHLPWDKVPVEQRFILEGFCGHGIFLAQAMERMGQDLDPKWTPRQRHQYFQKRLIGVEKDPLAIEVCRLLLTLSDYPNDNSWQLNHSDVFDWPEWDETLKSTSVVLANPPYEPFPQDERKRVNAIKAQPPAEFIHRVMQHPPAMLGLVLPQSFVSSPFFRDANRQIAQRYADVSIVELPKLFKYADNETVAVMASERRDLGKSVTVHYAEVLPTQTREFLGDFKVAAERVVNLDVPTNTQNFTLWIPRKGSIFDRLDGLPTLEKFVSIGKGLDWKKRTDGKPRSQPRMDVASDSPKAGFLRGAEKMAGNLSQFQIQRFRYLSLLPEHNNPRDKSWGRPWKQPKVVCNAARFERKSPWRLAAWADAEGRAFTKHYFALWPAEGISEFALAAVLSSPVANAFCYSRDLDRHNHKATLNELPIPAADLLGHAGIIHRLAKDFQKRLASSPIELAVENPEQVIESLIRIDAAVLEAYDLPARVQRQLLNQFQGWKRPMVVPFTGYFPAHFKDDIALKDFCAIKYGWDETNERRCDLIEKELSKKGLTPEERYELDHLQHLADLLVRLKEPYPLEELGNLVSELKAKGKWKPST